MAALTASIEIDEKDGVIHSAPMAVDIIFRGAMLVHNAAGFLAPVTGAEAGAVFAGIAEEEVDNSGGSAGDLNCKYRKDARWLLTGTSFAQADVGTPVYGSDDQTVTKTFAANLPRIGVIDEFVSATQVWVKIDSSKDVGEAAIADLGSTTEIPDVATGGTPDNDAAAVDTALDVVETRLDNVEVKVDAMLASLRKLRIIQG